MNPEDQTMPSEATEPAPLSPDDNTLTDAAPAGPVETEFRSGYVAILGKPNAGKSTLLNALVGQKVAITSDKPQTTRDRISGILTTDRFQMVFVDTPGVLVPKDRFNEAIMSRAAEALDSVDVIYHLIDVIDKEPVNDRLLELLKRAPRRIPRFLVVNKVDKVHSLQKGAPLRLPPEVDAKDYDDMILVSAMKKQGLDLLLERTLKHLKPGPHYFDPEQISDRDMRFFVSEIVREKVFRRTGAEIPYSVYCETEEYQERPDKDYIRVVIVVERDSQKPILIGEGGRVLKEVGRDARLAIEAMTDKPCFLELWVKVRKDWRKKEFDLNNFGFKLPKHRRKLPKT